jgi:hypothetical protein
MLFGVKYKARSVVGLVAPDACFGCAWGLSLIN